MPGWLATILEWMKWLLVELPKPDTLKQIVAMLGIAKVYAVLFGIIFAETGLLIGFCLPGDSLLFAAGFLAGGQAPVFDIVVLNVGLMIAAIVGDAVNYFLGRQMGEYVFEKGRLRFVKHEHLMAAKDFYEKHGVMAIVIARFVPIVRTFTPFVAGVSRMGYANFAFYNIVGGIGWVLSMTLAGYFLGQIPFVQTHFEKFVYLIVVVSVLPMVIGIAKGWWNRRHGMLPANCRLDFDPNSSPTDPTIPLYDSKFAIPSLPTGDTLEPPTRPEDHAKKSA